MNAEIQGEIETCAAIERNPETKRKIEITKQQREIDAANRERNRKRCSNRKTPMQQ